MRLLCLGFNDEDKGFEMNPRLAIETTINRRPLMPVALDRDFTA
jgi:hypothetical protein